MIKTVGYAAQGATEPLDAFRFERREPGKNDVRIEILYCGVCHSDLHTARNEWKGTTYPVVPGHEIVGRVSQVGSGVKGLRAGRPGRCRLHGRLVPELSRLHGRTGTVLPQRDHLHLQQPRPAHGRDDLRRLLGLHRRGREVRPAGADEPRPPCGRPASVRGHHDLLPAAPLEGRQGRHGWRGRPRRAGAHGGQAGQRFRCERGDVHDLAGQGRRCEAAGGRRGGHLEERRTR